MPFYPFFYNSLSLSLSGQNILPITSFLDKRFLQLEPKFPTHPWNETHEITDSYYSYYYCSFLIFIDM